MLQNVYHELSNNDKRNIESLRELGLYSRLESLKRRGLCDMISFEEWLDSVSNEFLPPHLKHKGFSRLASVFAWPHIPQGDMRSVELAIDREENLVLPHDCYTSGVHFGKGENLFVRRYWSEALLLKDFLKRYSFRPLGETNYYVWQDENDFSYTQPEVIFRPEAIKEFKKILPIRNKI